MTTPANLQPGLNDISDVLEEMPLEVSRYMTLLYEIDAKCVNIVPELNRCIEGFLDGAKREDDEKVGLDTINQWFQELIPSLEEKMHVSSIAIDSIERLTDRLELAYEVAIRNEEIPEKLRLGNDNHPAMHLHRELMAKVESNAMNKSQQALKSESRREAMAARRQPGNATSTTAIAGGASGASGEVVTSATPDVVAALQNSTGANGSSQQVNQGGIEEDTNKRKRGGTGAATAPHTQTTSSNTGRKSKKRATIVNNNTTTAHPAHTADSSRPKTNEYGEALYCYCNQVAYGEMVGCDGENCELEWFHLPCIGLETLPRGKWYCDDCTKKL